MSQLTHDQAARAILHIAPAADFDLSGAEIVGWRGPGSQPTPEAIEAAWAAIQNDPALPSADALQAYAKAARKNKEMGGITFGGYPIATDDRSKLMILGARAAARADAGWSTLWDGVVAVDAEQMIALSDAVQAHVNECFLTYGEVLADIANETITTFAQIDEAFE